VTLGFEQQPGGQLHSSIFSLIRAPELGYGMSGLFNLGAGHTWDILVRCDALGKVPTNTGVLSQFQHLTKRFAAQCLNHYIIRASPVRPCRNPTN